MRPAIAHWNGGAWSAATLPALTQDDALTAITAAAPNNIWAVGHRGLGSFTPLVLRYNGSAWASVPTPAVSGGLFDVDSGPDGAIWAVGSQLTLRWDGAQFQEVPTPQELLMDATELAAVAVSAHDNVWAAGTGGSGGKLLHWDGTAWELFASASDASQPTGYNALLATGPGDLWAVGYFGAQRGRTLVQRYQNQISVGIPRIVDDGAEQAFELTLGLSRPAATTVRARVRTEDAGAVAGRDYTALDTTITIPPCAQSATVQVPLLPGATPPAGAGFRLIVEGVSGAAPARLSRLVALAGPEQLLSLPLLGAPVPQFKGRIAYTATTGGSGTLTERDIFTVGIDGSSPRQLTNAPGQDFSPAWSPDGSRIAFVSERDGNANLYLMNADGSGQVALTTDPSDELGPAWSPDGSHIAFISNRSGEPLIYLMSASGGPARLLSPPETTITAGSLSWAPDGTRIVFESTNTRAPGLYILGLDGTLHRLTDQAGDITPAWSPDGSQIAFYGSRNNLSGLYLIRPDGSGLREVNVNFDTDGAPSWSPDGTAIAMGYSADGMVTITGLQHTAIQQVPTPHSNSFTPAWSPQP